MMIVLCCSSSSCYANFVSLYSVLPLPPLPLLIRFLLRFELYSSRCEQISSPFLSSQAKAEKPFFSANHELDSLVSTWNNKQHIEAQE